MVLYHDTSNVAHRLYSTLNEDMQLTSDDYGRWDLKFEDGDIVNLEGLDSLVNACVIAIMTRKNELYDNPLYVDFGCRVHELIKDNKSFMTVYKIEQFITDTLENMRRVKKVNWVKVYDSKHDYYSYDVVFNITSIDNLTGKGELSL
jgi:hypothetical protein